MTDHMIRLVLNAFVLWLTSKIVSGVELSGGFFNILLVALIFGLINALIKPVVKLLSLPFIIVTLGFFTLLINALMLWFTAGLTDSLSVSNFTAAFLGGIVISIVSTVLSVFVDDNVE